MGGPSLMWTFIVLVIVGGAASFVSKIIDREHKDPDQEK